MNAWLRCPHCGNDSDGSFLIEAPMYLRVSRNVKGDQETEIADSDPDYHPECVVMCEACETLHELQECEV
jgi:hypothetical protein